jgi:hypothetical protein
MKIISNFLEKDDFNNLKNLFYSDNFPWYLAEGVVRPGDGQIQFIHNFYKNFAISSSFFSLIYPVLIKLNVISLIRIKANFLYKTNKIIEHGYHTDIEVGRKINSKTAVLYINTNNGYTKFKNGKTISSEENKIVIFDTNILHTGSTCTDKDTRVVINFNYYGKDS